MSCTVAGTEQSLAKDFNQIDHIKQTKIIGHFIKICLLDNLLIILFHLCGIALKQASISTVALMQQALMCA